MSYILDALKKADADRERDAAAVPDLHAQIDAARGALAAARPSRAWLVALGVGALVLAGLAWRWFDASTADVPPPPAAQVPAPAATPAPATVQDPPAPPPAVTSAAPVVAADPAPIPSLAATTPPPRRPAREAAAAPAVAAETPPRAVPGQPALPAAPVADSKVYSLAELPPDVRSRLPALTVGGSMYSPNARSRMVILNGQVFREGDKPVDGLSVEKIGLKSTVMAFRGVRFELKH